MSSPLANNSLSDDIYLQIIPHFILRQFTFGPSEGFRQKVRNFWRTRNVPSEQIFVYDIVNSRLQRQPVPRPHIRLDLFKDLKDSMSIEYVQSQLIDLENIATDIARDIHNGLEGQEVTLPRERLSILRKFFFITHYRGLAVHKAEETKGLTSPQSSLEECLRGLKYYLDTPHYDIIAAGKRLRERYGNARIDDMLHNQSYPDSEELAFQYALHYEYLSEKYFLGVWVAAEESEFVLSGNSFSIREGSINSKTEVHRLHILNPRIAMVLRRTCLNNPSFNHRSSLHSYLAGVPISRPDIRYNNEDFTDPQDSFRFPYTRLSCQQTNDVNEVIMMNTNLRHNGFVIFQQPSMMRKTVDFYMRSPHTFLGGKQNLFRPLLSQLDDSSSLPEGESESPSDFQLRLLLGFMIQGHIAFPSTYTRACLIFHMATQASLANPISLRMRKIQDAAIDKLRCVLDPPVPEESQPIELVQSLAGDESELFFSLIALVLDRASVSTGRSTDVVTTIITEAAIIGVTYWLAEERPDVLRDALSEWVHIWA